MHSSPLNSRLKLFIDNAILVVVIGFLIALFSVALSRNVRAAAADHFSSPRCIKGQVNTLGGKPISNMQLKNIQLYCGKHNPGYDRDSANQDLLESIEGCTLSVVDDELSEDCKATRDRQRSMLSGALHHETN